MLFPSVPLEIRDVARTQGLGGGAWGRVPPAAGGGAAGEAAGPRACDAPETAGRALRKSVELSPDSSLAIHHPVSGWQRGIMDLPSGSQGTKREETGFSGPADAFVTSTASSPCFTPQCRPTREKDLVFPLPRFLTLVYHDEAYPGKAGKPV